MNTWFLFKFLLFFYYFFSFLLFTVSTNSWISYSFYLFSLFFFFFLISLILRMYELLSFFLNIFGKFRKYSFLYNYTILWNYELLRILLGWPIFFTFIHYLRYSMESIFFGITNWYIFFFNSLYKVCYCGI